MTLNDFKYRIIASEGRHGNRNMDYCNWFFGNIEIFHERTYWNSGIPKFNSTPAQRYHFLKSGPKTEYWGQTTYSDLELAKKEAKQYNARVTKEFYCDDDNPHYFLIFDDLDKAIEQSFNELKKVDLV